KQRDEALAVQPDLAEQAVHQERGAGEVSRIFQDGEEQEKQRDLRDEDDDGADSRKNSVGQQVLEWSIGHARRRKRTQRADGGLDPVHDGGGEPEDGDEERAHDRREDQKSPDLVDEDAV